MTHGPTLSFMTHFPEFLQASGMRFYRKILRISYEDRVTYEEVRAKIQQAIGPHEDLLTIVKRRKLQWYGHVSRSSGLAKTIMKTLWKEGGKLTQTEEVWRQYQGTDRLEVRQVSGQWRTEKKWREMVVKSSVVPQRPSRLRNRWRWRWSFRSDLRVALCWLVECVMISV